jgi:HEAT repeat protein
MPRVFISYAKEDALLARRLYTDLTAAGIECWLDSECLLPGQDWKVGIESAIRQCRYFLALLSHRSVTKRGFIQRELRQAIEVFDEFAPDDTFIIPVRLEECEPRHNRLAQLQWVDLFEDYGKGLLRIRNTIMPPEPSDSFAETPSSEASTDAVVAFYTSRLNSSDPDERQSVARTLESFGPAAIGALRYLLEMLTDADPAMRHAAARAAVRIDKSAPTISKLINALPSLRTEVASSVLRELGNDCVLDPIFLPRLNEILVSELSADTYDLAYSIVRLVGRAGERAVPLLVSLLDLDEATSSRSRARADAAGVLATLGPLAIAAVPSLLRALDSEDKDVYCNAARALYAIGPTGIGATIEFLETSRSASSAFAFHCFKHGAEAAIPTLIAMLEQGVPAAATGLGGMRSSPDAVVPALIKGVTHKDAHVRHRSVFALGHFGEAALPAVPTLIKALNDTDYYVRRDAAQTLGELGPCAINAVPALRQAEHDPEGKVGRYAKRSLEKIRGG